MLIWLRHGETDWNAKSVAGKAGDVEGGQLRGNDPTVDLNEAGRQTVRESFLEICREYDVREIWAAMQYARDRSTAEIGADVCGAPIRNVPQLAPFNPGHLTGLPIEKVWQIISRLIENPGIAAPGGESVHEWLDEFLAVVNQAHALYAQDPAAVVLIVHGMEMRALPLLLGTGPMEKYQQQKVKPGEYVVIH